MSVWLGMFGMGQGVTPPPGVSPAQLAALQAEVDALAAQVAAFDTIVVEQPLQFSSNPDPGTQLILAPNVGRLVARLTPSAGVVNTVAQTSLTTDSWQSAADELNEGDIVTLVASGVYLNNSGAPSDFTLRSRADAVTQGSRAYGAVAAAAGGRVFRLAMQFDIGDTTTVGSGFLALGFPTGIAADDVRSIGNLGATIDRTQPIDWEVTAQHSVANANISAVATMVEVFLTRSGMPT